MVSLNALGAAFWIYLYKSCIQQCKGNGHLPVQGKTGVRQCKENALHLPMQNLQLAVQGKTDIINARKTGVHQCQGKMDLQMPRKRALINARKSILHLSLLSWHLPLKGNTGFYQCKENKRLSVTPRSASLQLCRLA